MRKAEVKIRQIIWAFKQSFKPTTYDHVIYHGEKYLIKSSLTNENIWNLFKIGETKPTHYRINGNELKLIKTFKRFIKVFKGHITFQKQSWGLIDCNNPIGTRLSYNNPGDIQFYKKQNKNFISRLFFPSKHIFDLENPIIDEVTTTRDYKLSGKRTKSKLTVTGFKCKRCEKVIWLDRNQIEKIPKSMNKCIN